MGSPFSFHTPFSAHAPPTVALPPAKRSRWGPPPPAVSEQQSNTAAAAAPPGNNVAGISAAAAAAAVLPSQSFVAMPAAYANAPYAPGTAIIPAWAMHQQQQQQQQYQQQYQQQLQQPQQQLVAGGTQPDMMMAQMMGVFMHSMQAQEERSAKQSEQLLQFMQKQADSNAKLFDELQDCKAGMLAHSKSVMDQQAMIPALTLDANSQQDIDKRVRERLQRTSSEIKDYIRHLPGCFNTVTGETVWMPVLNHKYNPDAEYFSSRKKSSEVLVLLSIPGFLLFLNRRFGYEEVTAVQSTVDDVKMKFSKFFKTATLPDDDIVFDSMLKQTPFAYSLSQAQRQKQLTITDHSRKNFMLIDGEDFCKVISSEPVTKHQKIPISSRKLQWDTLKLKRSYPPFHCSSTTTTDVDDCKVLPQFAELTADDKLLMPSFGVEWWSELLKNEAYKKFFKIKSNAVRHVQYGKVDKTVAVKEYTAICA
jgi:hypothetical protein